jgi:TPR repeat protein
MRIKLLIFLLSSVLFAMSAKDYYDLGFKTGNNKYFIISCNMGMGISCTVAGDNLIKKGEKFLNKACRMNDGLGCFLYAKCLEGDEKLKILKKSCRLKNMYGCFDLFNITKNKAYLKKACNFGLKRACVEVKNNKDIR